MKAYRIQIDRISLAAEWDLAYGLGMAKPSFKEAISLRLVNALIMTCQKSSA